MATIKPTASHAGPSARDLTPYQWRAAKFVGRASSGDSATAEQDQSIDVAGAGDHVVGIIFYPGAAAKTPTTIHTAGRLKVKLGFDGKAGDRIKPGPDGVALLARPGEASFGTLEEAAPTGALAPFLFGHAVAPGAVNPGRNTDEVDVNNLRLGAGESFSAQITLEQGGGNVYNIQGATGAARLEVRGPDGTVAASMAQALTGNGAVATPTAGTYTVVITAGNAGFYGDVYVGID